MVTKMKSKIKQRSLVIFENSIKSVETQKVYKYQLMRFKKWAGIQDYDDLLKADDKSIQRLVEDYLIHIKGEVSPNTIKSMLAPIELFYTMNEVNINSKRLHKMFPQTVKRSGFGSYTRKQIQKMLQNTRKKRTIALILFLVSSGCRVGALPELKMKDIENMQDGCKSVTAYLGSSEEYRTFLTPEASKALEDYFEERIQDRETMTSESPVFRKDYIIGSMKALSMDVGTIRSAIYMTLQGIRQQKVGKRYNVPTTHGLRKFFNTTMKLRKDVNLSLAEKLMGHSVSIPLDNNYFPASKDELFKEYCKAIPELTINDEARQKLQIIQLKEETEEHKKKEKEIDYLKTRFDNKEKEYEYREKRLRDEFDHKLKNYGQEFLEEFEKRMDERLYEESQKMEKEDVKMLKKMSGSDEEFLRLKEKYYNKNYTL